MNGPNAARFGTDRVLELPSQNGYVARAENSLPQGSTVYAEDTIAAIATPHGTGGIGVIRVSGPRAAQIANTVFVRSRRQSSWEAHRLYHGIIADCDGVTLDDAVAVLMRGPHSYTGEDVLELHCHGGPVLLRLILERVLRAGARAASAGEFTRRAFLNGKLDLVQVEAVSDAIAARTSEAAIRAVDQLHGGLSDYLGSVRQRLIEIKAHLEAGIDFAEESIDLDTVGDVAVVRDLIADVDRLLDTHARGRLLREGIRVAIAGRPNVGKSSLLNALLGEERAIVTSRPGTTRDVIEESADFQGVPIILSDCAGLRDTYDEVEEIGVARARDVARKADIVLLVFDTSVPYLPAPVMFDDDHTVTVLNKIDLPCVWSADEIQALTGPDRVVRVSAKERVGLDELRGAVLRQAGSVATDGLPVLTRSRHRDALIKVRESLQHTMRSLTEGAPPELTAVDLQAALDHVGALTGTVTNEDVLDAIFAEFCIGK